MKKHFFALGGVTNTKDFYKKFPTEEHFDNYVKMKYGGVYAYQEGGSINTKLSIVDLLESKGISSNFQDRKKLANSLGIKNYTGTASQNEQFIDAINNNLNSLNNKPKIKPMLEGTGWSFKNKNSFLPEYENVLPTFNKSKSLENTSNKSKGSNKQVDPRNLESGMIEDKNKGEMYVIKNNKVVKTFPIITGQNKNQNINTKGVSYLANHPEARGTPVGTYFSTPNPNLYGMPGFNMDPISAFGQPAPQAKDLAQHILFGLGPKGTEGYDPKEAARRTKIMQGPGEQRVGSYGCTNMYGQDINCLTGQLFPQGDTTIVVDSRRGSDKEFLKKKYGIKKMGGEPCYECGGMYNRGGQTLHPGGDGTYYQGNYFDEGGTTFIPEYGSAAYGLPQYNLGASYQQGGMAPVEQVPPPGPGQAPDQGPPPGSSGIDPQQVMQEVAQKLQQGEQPEQIMQELVQAGVPQDQAQQIIQQVMQQMQASPNPGGPEPNGVQEYPQPQAMYGMGMKYGGTKKKYKVGGEYEVSNDDIKRLIAQGYKIQYI